MNPPDPVRTSGAVASLPTDQVIETVDLTKVYPGGVRAVDGLTRRR